MSKRLDKTEKYVEYKINKEQIIDERNNLRDIIDCDHTDTLDQAKEHFFLEDEEHWSIEKVERWVINGDEVRRKHTVIEKSEQEVNKNED